MTRFEGHIAKFMGDGVLAYFGSPQAHEDEAERAVRAALAVVQAVGGLKTADGPMAAQVGIATGLVVVGDLIGQGAAQEEAVVGETPNLAARLQALAEPGKVIISRATRACRRCAACRRGHPSCLEAAPEPRLSPAAVALWIGGRHGWRCIRSAAVSAPRTRTDLGQLDRMAQGRKR